MGFRIEIIGKYSVVFFCYWNGKGFNFSKNIK